MEKLILAIQAHNKERVVDALKEPTNIFTPGGVQELNARWLIEKVDELKRRLPGAEISGNDRLRKRILGALLGEAMINHLKIHDEEKEIVRNVIAKRTALDHVEDSGVAYATLEKFFFHFDELKKQLHELRADAKITPDEFYSIWDHAANGAIYFTP